MASNYGLTRTPRWRGFAIRALTTAALQVKIPTNLSGYFL